MHGAQLIGFICQSPLRAFGLQHPIRLYTVHTSVEKRVYFFDILAKYKRGILNK
ncbi:MAG: hypothetical protein ACI8RD_008625 [Bacillariaceae sp.]|jgi:hypothetical protein